MNSLTAEHNFHAECALRVSTSTTAREQRLALVKHAGGLPENEENEDGEYIYKSGPIVSTILGRGGLGLPVPEYISI